MSVVLGDSRALGIGVNSGLRTLYVARDGVILAQPIHEHIWDSLADVA